MTSKLFICNVYSAINTIQCIFYLSLVFISRAWFWFSTFPNFLTTWNTVITVPVLFCANSTTWPNSGSFLIGQFFSSLCLVFFCLSCRCDNLSLDARYVILLCCVLGIVWSYKSWALFWSVVMLLGDSLICSCLMWCFVLQVWNSTQSRANYSPLPRQYLFEITTRINFLSILTSAL